jgi:septum formation protein
MPQQIILASSSVYRQNLLKQIQLSFIVALPTIQEREYSDPDPGELARKLSELKARSVAKHYPDDLIIGADQVAVLGEDMMAKPMTYEKAVSQLQQVSGKTVYFHSGIALYNPAKNVTHTDVVVTKVTFRELSDNMIQDYLKNEYVLNCGCSLKSEGLGISLLKSVESSDPTALVGLPLIRLCDFLIKEGYAPNQMA